VWGAAARCRGERGSLRVEVEALLEAHPLAQVLISMPGVGVRTATKILTIVGDASRFPTAMHLAAYTGLAPVTRRSGSSIKGETRSSRGNKTLKNALYLSAFASLRSDQRSRDYYQRKRAEGKPHTAALICLARRSVDVMFVMLRDRTPYRQPSLAEAAATTAA